MTDFGKIRHVEIRDIWPNEAADFTPWLVENIDRLGQALDMEIEVEEQEADVGDFSLDIRAKDLGTGRTVIIENQLTATDHDHLGKLLTYAGGFNAGVLVWIAKAIRDEHRKALEWLNDHTGPDIDCFGVVIEVIRIDDSKPAFNFSTVMSLADGPRRPSSAFGEDFAWCFVFRELRALSCLLRNRVNWPGWYWRAPCV